ncbi:hypothetical protein C3Y87_13255 [Carbonactinospora thermoautotrophica]|nr:hypothetical protein [Carbonactinospora thermoautotrophica]
MPLGDIDVTTLRTLLGRGLVSGGLGGLAAGAFSYLLAEPVMDRAVRLESARVAAEGAHSHAGEHHAEVFTRATQHLGLVVGTTVAGLALGVLFALAYALLYRRDPTTDPWGRSIRLAAAAFTGVYLLPFLRYPANPPGGGDPATIQVRTATWLGAIVISLLGLVAAWRAQAHLAQRGAPARVRQLATAGLLAVTLVLLFLLPGTADPIEVPAPLLWGFRLLSVSTQAVLWGVLGVTFGLLAEHTARAARAPSPTTAPA